MKNMFNNVDARSSVTLSKESTITCSESNTWAMLDSGVPSTESWRKGRRRGRRERRRWRTGGSRERKRKKRGESEAAKIPTTSVDVAAGVGNGVTDRGAGIEEGHAEGRRAVVSGGVAAGNGDAVEAGRVTREFDGQGHARDEVSTLLNLLRHDQFAK
jgi:hypothetical protein